MRQRFAWIDPVGWGSYGQVIKFSRHKQNGVAVVSILAGLSGVACGSGGSGDGSGTGAASGTGGDAAIWGAGANNDTGNGATAGETTGVSGDGNPSAGSVGDDTVDDDDVDGSGGAGVDGSGGGSALDEPTERGAREGLVSRLSRFEYANSVEDVLNVTLLPAELDPGQGGIPDDGGDGVFKHFADKQNSVEQHPLAYSTVADAVASRTDIPALAARLSVCTEASLECGSQFVEGLGRRLFRRPMDEREITSYGNVFAAALEEEADFEEASSWALRALLQAPPFLFKMEGELDGTPGEDRQLTDLELGARLASFIWVSVPDEELLALAEKGELLNEGVLAQQVDRMLADPRAQRFTDLFVTDFSRAGLASFEGATDADRAALLSSAVATFQRHFWEKQGSIAELFTMKEFMVNGVVAEILGLESDEQELHAVDVSGLPERIGFLTHPGSIAGMGDREVGSFVNRGKYLMERLLCRNPVAFPAGLMDELENFNASTAGFNEHERVAVRKTRAECWGCHQQFDPFAFGFSRFDGAGRYVGETDADGKPLPLDGWVPISTEAISPHYTNVEEYMNILATDETVQTCMTEHFISFATGRSTDGFAKLEADVVMGDYAGAGSTLAAMVEAVAHSQLFGSLRVQADPGGAP